MRILLVELERDMHGVEPAGAGGPMIGPPPEARWWWDHAECAGRWELFEAREYETEAKDLCARCPVFGECRRECDAAERHLAKGGLVQMVWAGETRDERWDRRRRARGERVRVRRTRGW